MTTFDVIKYFPKLKETNVTGFREVLKKFIINFRPKLGGEQAYAQFRTFFAQYRTFFLSKIDLRLG